MTIIIATGSILVLAALAWLAGKLFGFRLCPICTGVSLTWVGLLAASVLGYQVALIVPAILMGGSVVGITYQLEKRSHASVGALLFWKVLFIPSGFVAVYAVLSQLWLVVALALAFIVLASLVLLRGEPAHAQKGAAAELEKKMEQCC